MATLFQLLVVGIILVACLVNAAILYFLGKGLSMINDMMRQHRSSVDKGLAVSISGIDEVQGYMQLFDDMTSTVRSGLNLGLEYSDKGVEFLRSSVFQTGFPVLVWGGLLGGITARSFFGRFFRSRGKVEPVNIIPPPSVERQLEA